MEDKKPNFLRFLSRPTLLLVFEWNVIAIIVVSWAVGYVLFLSAGFAIPLCLFFSGFVAWFSYQVIKEMETFMPLKGYFMHLAWTLNIRQIRLNDDKMKNKYPELERIDAPARLLPFGFETEFYN